MRAVQVWDIKSGKPNEKPLVWKWGQKERDAETTDTLDFSGDGRRLVHRVDHSRSNESLCEGAAVRPWVRVIEVAANATKGQGTAPPDDVMATDECMGEIALRSRESDRLTVVTERTGP
ncbi:hypothetical protein [Streptomyces sp. V4I2]|uniref:hypothetical protein n=1 Tax=Streptomyces sp. V4I2 TaxID=3042280 RepID=UPI00278736D5|nr:hypothetical protein [Streptomyces sp. V4I2]MDQ1044385.1 hypothetical protein [Streptomyces sp. V4I2]